MKRRTKLLLGTPAALLVLLGFYASSFVIDYDRYLSPPDAKLRTDVARLESAKVLRVDTVSQTEQLVDILKDAAAKHLKVSIAGSRHSQGGHTYVDGGVVLDMSRFTRILAIDEKAKTITVQSGAKWDDIQRAISPHGLAVKVMQSSYVFTVGGTLSANAHGRDLDMTSVVETVKSFHLLLANGTIVNVSRTGHPELFRLVIGGYGLFGVILDVTLQLTDDEVYERTATVMDYKDFPDYFQKVVKTDPSVALLLARPSIAPKSFLKEMTVTLWKKTDAKAPEGIHELGEEQHVMRDKFFFNLSRSFDWAKSLRWSLQKKIESSPGSTKLMSRNNAMRPPETPLEFLAYYSAKNTDIIQEYYVPVRNFVPFMDEFRQILTDGQMNVISSTVRYVKANDETLMAYSPKEDSFAIIQMSNVGLSKKEQDHVRDVTQKLVDAAIAHGGSYYLTYQLYPTREQMYKAYPRAGFFFAEKKRYDPDERFTSKFYEAYRPLP